MRRDIMDKIYSNDTYLTYLRYHPNWYLVLNNNPNLYNAFVNEVKTTLHITTADKIDNFRKQIDFINGIIKYLNQ